MGLYTTGLLFAAGPVASCWSLEEIHVKGTLPLGAFFKPRIYIYIFHKIIIKRNQASLEVL